MSVAIPYSFFAEIAMKSTLLLSAAWLLTLLLRRKSAAVRHLAWNVTFAAVLALPFVAMALPALRVPVASSILSAGAIFRVDALGSAAQAAPEQTSQGEAALEAKSKPWTAAKWGVIAMAIWAVGAAVSWAQLLIGLAAMERLRRRAKSLEFAGLASMTRQLGIERQVSLLETEEGSMPFTYGVLRSTIFLPADAKRWEAERGRVVLLHELAHVRRGDGATHLLARMVLGLYWWNPIVRAAWHEFLKERERAADDLVLSLGAGASAYAGHLLEIASSMQSNEALGWAAVPMARRSQLEGRVSAILDPGRDRQTPRRASAIAASLVAILIMAPVAALEARSDPAQANVVFQASVSAPAAALMKEGDAARELQKWDRARAAYVKALAVLGSGPEKAPVLIHLGLTELAAKEYEKAIADFGRAQSADSSKTSEAQMWMAIAQVRQGHLDAAEALYQTALAAAEPKSPGAATIMELHAQLLRQQGRSDEAKTVQSEAAGIRAMQAAEASANKPAGPDVYKIGGEVSPPKVDVKVEPQYTEDARLAGYQGTVLLSIEIGADGVAHNIKVLRALAFGLDRKAIEAIGQWRFQPATKDGQPVKVKADVEVNFRLL